MFNKIECATNYGKLTGPPVAWNAPCSNWQVKNQVPQTAAL